MEAPPGLVVNQCSPSRMVCKLNKSLYGLKQASRQWYAKLTEALSSKGYQHSENDHSLFCKKTSTSIIFVAVYVDDVIITGIDSEEIASLKAFFDQKFRIKDLGRLHYFLGLEVLYKPDGILISQRNNVSSPLGPTVKLKAQEGNLLPDPTYYRKLVGKLNFLTNTRLDIAYRVQLLSQFMQAPRDTHLTTAFHLLRYLKKDPSLGVFFSNSPDCSIKAYFDSDWAACPDSRRSVTGYIVLVGDSPISWKSKKLFAELTVAQPSPIQVFCDSQSAILIAHNPVFYERTKHIEVDCHFVRNKLQEGLISLHRVNTHNQLADILTKALTGVKHSAVLGKLAVKTSLPT
ncbi:PREDICTED: uncharacterized protein LOC109210707 [Nicotiana attenuata]|uniref:uncharacterized protein LOC109210707 n=1 Tax=Nicotiana attenuata TaxID=49451 RepID=UPI000905A545|nr:PREDICTED: uncharacterized protein LOC109210707 [Nicotiana attenuata]